MATTIERPAVRTRPARSAPAGRGGRGESNTKLTLYVLAGVLGVVVFVVPLIWAVLRAFQPNSVITSATGLSSLSKLSLDNFRGLASEGDIPLSVGNHLIFRVRH